DENLDARGEEKLLVGGGEVVPIDVGHRQQAVVHLCCPFGSAAAATGFPLSAAGRSPPRRDGRDDGEGRRDPLCASPRARRTRRRLLPKRAGGSTAGTAGRQANDAERQERAGALVGRSGVADLEAALGQQGGHDGGGLLRVVAEAEAE